MKLTRILSSVDVDDAEVARVRVMLKARASRLTAKAQVAVELVDTKPVVDRRDAIAVPIS